MSENKKNSQTIGGKIKDVAFQMGGVAGAIEKFVEMNLLEKNQREENIKKISNKVGGFLRDHLGNLIPQARFEAVVRVKTLAHFKGQLPAYQSEGASGFDVTAQIEQPISLAPGERSLLSTGLCFEVPLGYEIQVRPRSGLAIKKGISLVNTPGTIDADYRGEVKIIVINLGQENVEINAQDRIAQMVLCPVVLAHFEKVDELSDTERGAGGFGSTGVQ